MSASNGTSNGTSTATMYAATTLSNFNQPVNIAVPAGAITIGQLLKSFGLGGQTPSLPPQQPPLQGQQCKTNSDCPSGEYCTTPGPISTNSHPVCVPNGAIIPL